VKLPERHAISLAEEGDQRIARRPRRIAVSRQAHAGRRGTDRREKKAASYPDIGIGMGKTLGRPRRSKDDTIGFRPLEPLLFDRGRRTGFRPGVVTGLEMIREPRNLRASGTAQVRQPSTVANAVQTSSSDAGTVISWTSVRVPSVSLARFTSICCAAAGDAASSRSAAFTPRITLLVMGRCACMASIDGRTRSESSVSTAGRAAQLP